MKKSEYRRLQPRGGGTSYVVSARITFMREDKEILALIRAAPSGKVAATIRELVRAGFRARRKQQAKHG